PGLIGTSVALAARRAWPAVAIAQFDCGDSLEAAADADVIVLATPVDVIIDILTRDARWFGEALVLDTGSTKRAILAVARNTGLQHFVGGHPMAGAASSGSRDARTDLFDGKPWFLIPADPASLKVSRAEAFVAALGATPVVMSGDGTDHDQVMAAVSHLPQVVASVLMRVVGQTMGQGGLQWAGGGLRDTTRLASSPSSIWESVLATNATELRPLLLELADEIIEVAHGLDDPDTVRRLFDAANHHRGRLTSAQYNSVDEQGPP
ncbi:MAG: prephenate dehydrogenase, partial [Vicinamibacterales bacterium]